LLAIGDLATFVFDITSGGYDPASENYGGANIGGGLLIIFGAIIFFPRWLDYKSANSKIAQRKK